jgi:hypothetical protein
MPKGQYAAKEDTEEDHGSDQLLGGQHVLLEQQRH